MYRTSTRFYKKLIADNDEVISELNQQFAPKLESFKPLVRSRAVGPPPPIPPKSQSLKGAYGRQKSAPPALLRGDEKEGS